VNGYALPFAAAAVADLLAAVSSGLAFAALPFLALGRASPGESESPGGRGVVPPEEDCAAMSATRQSLATGGGRQRWNVGGGE
jgi:hypothetical protein